MKNILILLIIGLLFLSGCLGGINDGDARIEPKNGPQSPTPADIAQAQLARNAGYYGRVLMWENSIFLDFDERDYENALTNGKTIVLYFYANWCPVCRRAVQDVELAFNELESDQVVGFRVNYKDDETDDLEKQLAKEHGVAYQHTFIIVQNGERVFKTPEVLSRQRVLEEINKVV